MSNAPSPKAAAAFIAFLASPAAKTLFAANKVEPGARGRIAGGNQNDAEPRLAADRRNRRLRFPQRIAPRRRLKADVRRRVMRHRFHRAKIGSASESQV